MLDLPASRGKCATCMQREVALWTVMQPYHLAVARSRPWTSAFDPPSPSCSRVADRSGGTEGHLYLFARCETASVLFAHKAWGQASCAFLVIPGLRECLHGTLALLSLCVETCVVCRKERRTRNTTGHATGLCTAPSSRSARSCTHKAKVDIVSSA